MNSAARLPLMFLRNWIEELKIEIVEITDYFVQKSFILANSLSSSTREVLPSNHHIFNKF